MKEVNKSTLSGNTVTGGVSAITDGEKTVTDREKTVTDGEKTVTDREKTVTDRGKTITDRVPAITDSVPAITDGVSAITDASANCILFVSIRSATQRTMRTVHCISTRSITDAKHRIEMSRQRDEGTSNKSQNIRCFSKHRIFRRVSNES